MTDPDPTEDWLREGLADAVPDPPGTPERAAAARGRARRARRRTTLVAAAGVVATLAVVGVVSTTLRDGSSRDETAAEPTSPIEVAGCPRDPDASTSGTAVPEGAVSVRLCRGEGAPIDVPADALVTGPDRLVALVNDLEQVPEPNACKADFGPGYHLVFAYDDGRAYAVAGELYGCRIVRVGDTYRADAQRPWDRFVELLREQRKDLDPPSLDDVAAVDCAPGPGRGIGRPQDLVAASYCYGLEDAEWSEIEIPSEDLAVLVADLAGATGGPEADIGCGPDVTNVLPSVIVGRTAWGDRVELQTSCMGPDVPPGAAWSTESREILRRLSAAAARAG